MLVEDLRGRILADRQIIAVYKANGADIELPDLDEQREKFDEWLHSPVTQEPIDLEQQELLQALGLRGG